MLAGQNGILNRAAESKEKTGGAQGEEQIKLAVMAALTDGTGTLTIPNLKKELASYGITIAEDATFPVTVSVGGKSYTIASTGEVTKVGSGSVTPTPEPTVPEGPKVGDSVTYSPSGTYNWQAKYYSSTSSFDDATLNSANGENFNLIKWRVLSIENGRVELVPNEPTSGTVHLRESQGYNNGVKLLNDACSSLYGNTSKGITARSLNIDDIEKYMLEAKLTEAHSYTGNAKYGNQVSSAYTRYYPVMYEREKLSVINGSKKTDGLGMSEQTNFIEKTDSGASNGYSNALTSIQPYQTYWYKDNSYMQNAFRTAEGGTNYYDLLIKTSTNYWLASRCVQTYSDNCGFYMRRVYSGGIDAFDICYQINRKYLWLQLCAISRSFSKH